jgi:SAM-dependent methyltransferase
MDEFQTRIVEPELMNGQDQVIAYGQADFSASDQAFIDFISERFPAGMGNSIVDLGCGPGNISELAVKQWPHASVLGIDGADRMLDHANTRKMHLPDKYSKRLYYKLFRLGKDNPAAIKSFFWPNSEDQFTSKFGILSNSLLHHLHDPQVLWDLIKAIANIGSPVIINDLLRPDNWDKYDVLMRFASSQIPAELLDDYSASLKAAFSINEVKEQLIKAKLDYMEVEQRSNQYLCVSGVFQD